jgi:hypothetical protein
VGAAWAATFLVPVTRLDGSSTATHSPKRKANSHAPVEGPRRLPASAIFDPDCTARSQVSIGKVEDRRTTRTRATFDPHPRLGCWCWCRRSGSQLTEQFVFTPVP